jgi:ATP-dependent protease HslVU (ClpYQ) peptidase subunit
MTCIVGIVDKEQKNVIIGADSAGSTSNMKISIRKDAKVFKNGDFLIGCTTSFRMAQLLNFSFEPPKIGKKDIYSYMCTDFIDAVRNCFKEGGFLQKDTDGDEKGGMFLVGYKNRLFRIENDFQVAENLNGIDSVGGGSDFALGALFSLSEQNLTAENKVLKSLEASEFFNGAVCRPFILIST